MLVDKQHILLISHTFPPYPGIGGRRWAKFAKYLSQLNYIVHVIHVANPFDEKSLWLGDIINNEKIKRYEIKSRYPKILLEEPRTFFEKVNYKLSLYRVKLTTKGTPYDRSVFCEEEICERSKSLIEKWGIKNVIVSCAPFSSAYYSILLKEELKHLNFLLDLRDPWTWGSAYGFDQLNASRLAFEKKKEKMVLTQFDTVFVPNGEMKKELNVLYKNAFDHKIHILPHAYDEDELVKNVRVKSQQIKMLFYGNLYDGLEDVFRKLAVFLSSKKDIYLDIYSSSKAYESIFRSEDILSTKVTYNDSKLPKELFKAMADYDCVLIVQPDYAKDFITTKIYEIIFTGIPIVLISKSGKLSEFVLTNKLGLWYNSEADLSDIDLSIIDNFRNPDFDIQDHSFRNATENLTTFLK